jgi:hypothetical protein
VAGGQVTVTPLEYPQAIRNPMKGLREFFGPGYDAKRSEYPYPFGTIIKEYMQWNMLEDYESDGMDKIIAYSNHRWAGVENINVKVIPRIFIVWMEPWHGGYAKNTYTSDPDDLNGWHWPSDIPGETYSSNPNTPITGGYFDPTFQDRVAKLVAKAGQAWDNDPRVAYIEMGIIGEWGEHHDPDITTYWPAHDQPNHVANRTWIPGIKETLGDAFTAAFRNKKVMVRYAYDWPDYEFGVYWDSWGMAEEQTRGYEEIKKLGNRWKTQPIGGEITWNWGNYLQYSSFEDVIANTTERAHVIEQIRNLHCNHLGGVTWANFNDAAFMVNADMIQKALGYRYVLSGFTYPTHITPGQSFTVSCDVTNTGSSPFYYDWPVEIALLDPDSHAKVWSSTISTAYTSQWMPGEDWDTATARYTTQPAKNHLTGTFTAPNLTGDRYIISITILDPAGMLPSIRFAASNYFKGGRHPMGYIGVNKDLDKYEIDYTLFDNIRNDKTLKYKLQ